MDFGDFTMPDELFYHERHCWVRPDGDGNTGVIGMDDFGQKLAGTIKNLMLLEAGDTITRNRPLGTMSSGKWTGKLYSPVSGEILEKNADAEDMPDAVNDDPYGEGWFLRVRFSDPSELETLFRPGTPRFIKWMDGQMKEYMD